MVVYDVKVIQVVVTRLSTRGKGVEGSPIRRITEVWDMDGKKIAEFDPYDEMKGEFRYTEKMSGVPEPSGGTNQ